MPRAASRPTLKSIAKVAGVTTATVSMALRGLPAIPKTTRKRIEAAAASLGYRPDPTLTRLMSYLRLRPSRPSAALAMVTVREKPAPWRENAHLRRYYDGAVRRADELGFRVEELWLGAPNLTAKRMKEMLLVRGIEGLFLFSGQRLALFPDFDFSPFACATYGRWSGRQSTMDRAATNYYLDMLKLIEELARLGYRRPGLALETEFDERTAHLYSAAFLWAQHTGRFERSIPILSAPAFTEELFRKWALRHRPDVVIAQSPQPSVYLRWLQRAGLAEKTGFATLDIDLSDPLRPSGIRQDNERIGAAVVDMIATQIQRGERGLSNRPRVLMFEGEWVAGATTRPV